MKNLSELLQMEDGTSRMINECLKLADKSEKLVVFGAGAAENEYSFFLRQYRYTDTETVCYMIPRDRMSIKF